MKYRFDINGLRAISVMAVVFFHFNKNFIPGGFIGVDIFFVISGYLMTDIIINSLKLGRFSVVKFYISRSTRIIPPLIVVCLFMILYGLFFFTPVEYKKVALHALSSLFFVSNFIFLNESGYFDDGASEKWLLNTWSLSVEWQFYVIYPLLIFSVYKTFGLRLIKPVIIFITFISFICSVFLSHSNSATSYFMISTRAWEMLFGGLVFLYPLNLHKNKSLLMQLSGLVIIFVSFFSINESFEWPSYWAALPVIGASMIIASKHDNKLLFENKLIKNIGQWSYSIYLWHWPIFVFGYMNSIRYWWVFGIPISIFFGCVSYFIIETKRNKVTEFVPFMLSRFTLFYLSVCAICVVIYISNGYGYLAYRLENHNKNLALTLEKKIIMPSISNGYCFYDYNDTRHHIEKNKDSGLKCTLGTQGIKPSIMLFGSSFAGMYDPFLDVIFKGANMSFESLSTNWCTPSFTKNFTGNKSSAFYERCIKNRLYLKDAINKNKFKSIIISDNWRAVIEKGYFEDVIQVISLAKEKGIRIIVLPSPTQYIKNPVKDFLYSLYSGDDFVIKNFPEKNNKKESELFEGLLSSYSNVTFVKKTCMFKSSDEFKWNGIQVPYTLDGGHISFIGSINIPSFFRNSECYKDFLMAIEE